jgi:oxalate decarboxylase/phosphoglucose isomerase-like protein (cupin superfamily)
MTQKERSKYVAYFETLVQNAQKGELFTIKLKGNPVIYTAMPLMHYSMDTARDTMFMMKVVDPPELQGVYKESIENIEFLERKAFNE